MQNNQIRTTSGRLSDAYDKFMGKIILKQTHIMKTQTIKIRKRK